MCSDRTTTARSVTTPTHYPTGGTTETAPNQSNIAGHHTREGVPKSSGLLVLLQQSFSSISLGQVAILALLAVLVVTLVARPSGRSCVIRWDGTGVYIEGCPVSPQFIKSLAALRPTPLKSQGEKSFLKLF